MGIADDVQEVRRLREERRYDEALSRIARTLPDPRWIRAVPDPGWAHAPRRPGSHGGREAELTRDLLIVLALIHDDYGRYAQAARSFELASRCLTDDAQSHRLAAIARERRYRSAERPPSGREKLRDQIRAELDASIASAQDDADTGRLMPLYWARARLRSGAHPDDRPMTPALEQAAEDIERARRLERGTSLEPGSRRLRITAVRLARLRAAYPDSQRNFNRSEAIEQARATLESLRDQAFLDGSAHDPLESQETAFLYEEARLELVARRWDRAARRLQDVIDQTTPCHQAAQVWQIYCRRMQGEPADDLLRSIDALLHERVGDKPPAIVNGELRAELLSERAALIEARDPLGALRDYEAVRTQRPRMPFALRGAIRCRYMSGDRDGAHALAKALLSRDTRPEDRLTADVLAEIGQLRMDDPSSEDDPAFTDPIRHFDLAIERLPIYGFAYGRKSAALRTQGHTREGVRFAERTIDTKRNMIVGLGSVRVELGYSYLAVMRMNSAVAQFKAAEEDVHPVVRDRARAGLIRALLWKRDLAGARDAVATRRTGDQDARLQDAAGWFYGTVGVCSKALEHFIRADRERPYEPSATIGQARVLRLLGRPAAARRLLKEKAALWPESTAMLLHSEIGWAAIDERQYDDALDSFKSVLSFYPKSQAALRGYIVAAARSGSAPGAVHDLVGSALEKVGEDDPRARASVLTEAGTALLACGDERGARRMFLQANELSTSVSQRLIQGHALLQAFALPEALARVADAESLAAKEAGSQLDIPAIRKEAGRLVDDVVREPENFELLSADFDTLLGDLTRTASGVAVGPGLRTLWDRLRSAVEVAGGSADTVKREILGTLDQLDEREVEAVESLPRDPDVLLLEGACHLAEAAPQRAIKAFEEAARSYGEGSVLPVLGKALVMLEQQQYEAARQCLLPLAEDPRGSIRARELLAWSMLHLEQQGDPAKGALRSRLESRELPRRMVELLGARHSHRTEIVNWCRAIIEEEPSRVDAFVCLGVLAMHERRTAEALSYLRQAIAAGPRLAHPLREMAAALLRIEDHRQAAAHISEALAIDPHDARAHLLRGLIALEQGQPLAAMAVLRQAQELDPFDPHAALSLATALQHAGRDNEAIDELTRAIKVVRPHRSVPLLLARARAQHSLARTHADSPQQASLSSALTDAVRAAELARTARDRAEAEYHRGVILFARHRTKAAGRALRAAIRQDPDHLRARQALAAVRESGGEDSNERLLRRAAYVTIAFAAVTSVLILLQGVLTAKATGADFHWTPIGYIALTPLVAIAFAGLLPRIARVKVREVEITITAPSSAPETPSSTIDFGRMPLSTLWGPSTYRVTDIVSDLSGLPEW